MFKNFFQRKANVPENDESGLVCPLCKAEYRTGFTQCGTCNVSLVSPSLLQSKQEDVSLKKEFRPIRHGEECVPFLQGPVMEMKMTRHYLESQGVAVRLFRAPQEKKG